MKMRNSYGRLKRPIPYDKPTGQVSNGVNMNRRVIIIGTLLLIAGMVIFASKEKLLSEIALLKGMVIILQLPKRRHSKSRRDKRRAQWKIKSPNLSRCPQCGAPKLPHRVCPECGYYEGREIIPPKKKKKEEKKK